MNTPKANAAMPTNTLRKIILRNRITINDIMPTDQQAKIIEFVRVHGKTTSNQVSHNFATSLALAAGQLKVIYSKGFLSRHNIGDPSGGAQYQYTYTL